MATAVTNTLSFLWRRVITLVKCCLYVVLSVTWVLTCMYKSFRLWVYVVSWASVLTVNKTSTIKINFLIIEYLNQNKFQRETNLVRPYHY